MSHPGTAVVHGAAAPNCALGVQLFGTLDCCNDSLFLSSCVAVLTTRCGLVRISFDVGPVGVGAIHEGARILI